MRRVTKHFLQGNVPLRHLLNAKSLFMSWQRYASNEVNNWAHNNKNGFFKILFDITHTSKIIYNLTFPHLIFRCGKYAYLFNTYFRVWFEKKIHLHYLIWAILQDLLQSSAMACLLWSQKNIVTNHLSLSHVIFFSFQTLLFITQ